MGTAHIQPPLQITMKLFALAALVATTATAQHPDHDPHACPDIKKAEVLSEAITKWSFETTHYIGCNTTHPHTRLHKVCDGVHLTGEFYHRLQRDSAYLHSDHCTRENQDDYKNLCEDMLKGEHVPFSLKNLNLVSEMYEYCFEKDHKHDDIEHAVCKDLAASTEAGLGVAGIYNTIFDRHCLKHKRKDN